MTTVTDLHPEALLDRAAHGELTPSERTRLDAHLARCPACRFEQQLRSDFADDLLSDVTPSSVELLLAGSSRAGSSKPLPSRASSVPEPAEVIAPSETPAPLAPLSANSAKKSVAPPPARRRRVSRATWLLVAAAVFGVSVAAASGSGQRALSRFLGGPSASVAAEEGEPLPQHVAAKHVSRHRTAPVPMAASASTEASREPPTTLDVLLPSGGGGAPNVTAPVEATARRGSTSGGAPALFEAATEARRHGDYGRALVLQRELVSRYPQSREAHVSRATVGRLLLDRGDPSGALGSFDAYLAGGSGELGEEAMVGRATALERLGRTSEAVGAWQALLAAYPETVYAAHARSRLGSMSVR